MIHCDCCSAAEKKLAEANDHFVRLNEMVKSQEAVIKEKVMACQLCVISVNRGELSSFETICVHERQKEPMKKDATLRDYFAAHALSGFLGQIGLIKSKYDGISCGGADIEYFSKRSYELADAMIAARNKNV